MQFSRHFVAHLPSQYEVLHSKSLILKKYRTNALDTKQENDWFDMPHTGSRTGIPVLPAPVCLCPCIHRGLGRYGQGRMGLCRTLPRSRPQTPISPVEAEAHNVQLTGHELHNRYHSGITDAVPDTFTLAVSRWLCIYTE
jgi:hypothetical protein